MMTVKNDDGLYPIDMVCLFIKKETKMTAQELNGLQNPIEDSYDSSDSDAIDKNTKEANSQDPKFQRFENIDLVLAKK